MTLPGRVALSICQTAGPQPRWPVVRCDNEPFVICRRNRRRGFDYFYPHIVPEQRACRRRAVMRQRDECSARIQYGQPLFFFKQKTAYEIYFGPVASSPVIRGLSGPRVLITQNGLDAGDVSRVGPD